MSGPREAQAQDCGLIVYRASRLEALLDPLRELLAATRPTGAGLLRPQTIIAAHAGMKPWLTGALAHAAGREGIVANLDIVLPSAWIDALAQRHLGERAVALPRYARAHLRWAIHDALTHDPAALGIDDPLIAPYLQADADDAEAARRRFQLADRLAGLYSRYLVYRPDWLLDWQRGRFASAARGDADRAMRATEQRLLAPLWKHLHERLGPHRADVVGQLVAALERGAQADDDEAALHVFGIAHLAPSELGVLRACARQRLVALYVPDPCRQYWGGLERDGRHHLARLRAAESARIEQAQGGDWWTPQAHPLLARWGRMGQHFMLALADADEEVREDVRHWRDERPQAPRDRLERVQQSIRELDPARMDSTGVARAAEIADASLRVHVCHTRLRELEVLRDQLLDALAAPDADGARLKPADILVTAPDIRAYAPLIPAVFGVAGDARQALPYHLADVAMTHGHALLGAFGRLLDLPAARITAAEILDLLARPEVARRFDLDAEAIDQIGRWLARGHVAWALDARFRRRFGAPAIDAHSFAWGLDRLLAGYLAATAADDARQPALAFGDGVRLLPLGGIDGPAAAWLGALEQLLERVQRLCDLAERTLPASVWSNELESLLESLFRVDPADPAASEARSLLLRGIRGLAAEPALTGLDLDPQLHFAVVRDLLLERIDAVPGRQRFLAGGITFCGMVPQRAIPFRVIAVLGLNDGEYPRQSSDGGLDLMARYRRLGDRDARSDDRYLFLETLMSARARLHLSYAGIGVQDGKPRNPAAPLAELLAALDAAAGIAPDAEADRPWCVRHALQPFDARYFDGSDARWFSYAVAFAAAAPSGAPPRAMPPFCAAGDAPAPPIDPDAPWPTLQALRDYYRDPARHVLRDGLRLSLAALDDERLPSSEPLDARFAAIDRVTERLFFDAVLPAGAVPDDAPDWLRLSGLLPPGRPGAAAWENERETQAALLERARAVPGLIDAAGALREVEVDVRVGAQRLAGRVARVACGETDWLLPRVAASGGKGARSEAELDFRQRVPMFLDWAALRLQTADLPRPPALRLCMLLDGKPPRPWLDALAAWDEAFLAAAAPERAHRREELERRIAMLIGWRAQAPDAPLRYFPQAAWAILREQERAESGDDIETNAAAKVWLAERGGERDRPPGYNRLLGGSVDFANGSAELAALRDFARRLDACITPGGDAARERA